MGDYSCFKNKARRFFSIATFSQRWSRFARVAILAQGELICSGCLDELLGRAETYHVKGRGDLNALNQSISNLKEEQDFGTVNYKMNP